MPKHYGELIDEYIRKIARPKNRTFDSRQIADHYGLTIKELSLLSAHLTHMRHQDRILLLGQRKSRLNSTVNVYAANQAFYDEPERRKPRNSLDLTAFNPKPKPYKAKSTKTKHKAPLALPSPLSYYSDEELINELARRLKNNKK